MTKEELLQYGSIKRELADIQKRLSALEKNKGYHGMAYSNTPRQRGEPVPEAQRYVEASISGKSHYIIAARSTATNAIPLFGLYDLRTGMCRDGMLMGYVSSVA